MSLHERILVATDMSARSDRALDRAVMLAQRDGSQLVVLHVLSDGAQRRARDLTFPALLQSLRSHLIHDLGACADKATIRIEEGDAIEVITRVAREQASTLVIIGVSRTERLGRPSLGSTAERLVRTIEQPLLLVTDRPRAPYSRVAVAVDFSSLSTQSVVLAANQFPDQSITLVHAFQPMATYGAVNVDAHRDSFRSAAEYNYDEWLASADLPPTIRERIRPQIIMGEPADAVRQAAETGDLDLVVITTHGRGRIFEFFVGSVAKRMLAELPCDALLIREAQLEAASVPVAATRANVGA